MAVYGPGAIDAAPAGVPVADRATGWLLGAETKWRTAGSGFLGREECEHSSQGKKAANSRCGMAIETKSSLGHTRSIEVCVGAAQASNEREPGSWPGVHRRSPTATVVMAPLSPALSSPRPADSVEPSTTPHPPHVNGKRVGRHRLYGDFSIPRVSSGKQATRVSRHLLGG